MCEAAGVAADFIVEECVALDFIELGHVVYLPEASWHLPLASLVTPLIELDVVVHFVYLPEAS
jgi:hypothetical protein